MRAHPQVTNLAIAVIAVVAFTIVLLGEYNLYSAAIKGLTATPPVLHQYAKACWTEPKTGTNLPPEQICGDVALAPANATNFTDYP